MSFLNWINVTVNLFNFLSGTVVDSETCHTNDFGFYLCSQIVTQVNFTCPDKIRFNLTCPNKIYLCVRADYWPLKRPIYILVGNDPACALSHIVGWEQISGWYFPVPHKLPVPHVIIYLSRPCVVCTPWHQLFYTDLLLTMAVCVAAMLGALILYQSVSTSRSPSYISYYSVPAIVLMRGKNRDFYQCCILLRWRV